MPDVMAEDIEIIDGVSNWCENILSRQEDDGFAHAFPAAPVAENAAPAGNGAPPVVNVFAAAAAAGNEALDDIFGAPVDPFAVAKDL